MANSFCSNMNEILTKNINSEYQLAPKFAEYILIMNDSDNENSKRNLKRLISVNSILNTPKVYQEKDKNDMIKYIKSNPKEKNSILDNRIIVYSSPDKIREDMLNLLVDLGDIDYTIEGYSYANVDKLSNDSIIKWLNNFNCNIFGGSK